MICRRRLPADPRIVAIPVFPEIHAGFVSVMQAVVLGAADVVDAAAAAK